MNEEISNNMTIDDFLSTSEAIVAQLHKVIVGQKALVHDFVVTLLAAGNALLEGVPGLGKTLLVRTLAKTVDCSFKRVQFTPDLMPADIIGTMILTETAEGRRGFRFERGPIFSNIVLADEINRAAPRTQSALLEAMQEQSVTVAGETNPLPQPFFVLATQNPIEMEGTYPLPEAQMDRFLYRIDIPYPSEDDLVEIANRTTGSSFPEVEIVADGKKIIAMQELSRNVPASEKVIRYVARLVEATHPENDMAVNTIKRNVHVGVSPRGMQAILLAAKVEALLDNRKAVAIDDVRKVAYPALRHRLILNFEARAEGIPADAILDDVLEAVPVN